MCRDSSVRTADTGDRQNNLYSQSRAKVQTLRYKDYIGCRGTSKSDSAGFHTTMRKSPQEKLQGCGVKRIAIAWHILDNWIDSCGIHYAVHLHRLSDSRFLQQLQEEQGSKVGRQNERNSPKEGRRLLVHRVLDG